MAEAMSVSYSEVSDGTGNLPYQPLEQYPLTPLLEESPAQRMNQSWVTQPEPQRELQFDPLDQFFLPSGTIEAMPFEPMWPVHAAGTNSLPAPPQTLADKFYEQLQQCYPVDTRASSQEAGHPEPSKAPRRKQRAVRNDDDLPVLTKPFSELLQDFDAVAEATKIVNRSVEERRLEAEMAGKVKRPSNSFILYRNAFLSAVRAFHGCPTTEASRIVAKSWSMERGSVRQAFQKIANMDKSLHEQAFPKYKFSPVRRCEKRKIESRKKRLGV